MIEEKDNMFLNASTLIFKRAEELRINMTLAEQVLWEELKGKKLNGCKFRRQHPILRYILDFYCHKKRLGIEIDGNIHNSVSQKKADDDRTQNLNNYDIKIIRFHNDEILNDMIRVKAEILEYLQ